MVRLRQRRASALLIVLGMLSFMVISAVAFSAYMRYSRLPSSFLRRSVASRLLVKAALERAIDEVDAAIGNNPHPNVGTKQYFYPRITGSNSKQMNRNHWLGRVFMGGTNSVDQIPIYTQESTVSPLCLEALAYIPTPLVNEVRYYSRHSQAAQWHELDYDAGRYAFCAVDVSDYFDINAIHADVPRLSTGSSRISLAYLFENADHTSASPMSGMCTPQQWDDFMLNFRPKGVSAADASSGGKGGNGGGTTDKGDTLPLISLADFNLALYKYKAGNLVSPFCQYIVNNSGSFYGTTAPSAESDGAETIRRQTFVTDSLMNGNSASTVDRTSNYKNDTTEAFDLSDDDNQPFDIDVLVTDNHGVDYLGPILGTKGKGGGWNRFRNNCLSGLGMCMLFDYLDKDSVPLSLAIPTVERVPMICGIDVSDVKGNIEIAKSGDSDEKPTFEWDPAPGSAGGDCKGTYKVQYQLTGLDGVLNGINVLVMYPFRNGADNKNAYTIKGRMSFFLTVDGNPIKLRTENQDDYLHLSANGNAKSDVDSTKPYQDAVYSVQLNGSINIGDFGLNDEKSTISKSIRLTPASKMIGSGKKISLGSFQYQWKTKDTTSADQFKVGNAPNPKDSMPSLDATDFSVTEVDSCKFKPLNNSGVIDDIAKNNALIELLKTKDKVVKLNVNVAVWVWIEDTTNNKVVDLVPACLKDDADMNGRSVSGKDMSKFGNPYPLMPFNLSLKNECSIIINPAKCANDAVFSVDNSVALEPSQPTIFVGDPRFNHAPESWFYNDSATFDANGFLGICGRNESGRDGDIFMQTSDQGYLQSVYELCNILKFNELGIRSEDEGFYNRPEDAFESKNYRENYHNKGLFAHGSNFRVGANSSLMWRTFDPFVCTSVSGNDESYEIKRGDYGDDFDKLHIVSSLNGLTVNPYTDNTNVLMAALANTPNEWRFAADSGRTGNKITTAWDDCSKVEDFNKKYAWNEYTTGNSKMEWVDLEDVAGKFMEELRKTPNDQWADVYDDLGWYDKSKRENGTASKYLLKDFDLPDNNQNHIYNCDRKFLYGYWRECLSAKQQLFLVFVRAEPTMGGASLGAKAMALVWRDPTPTEEQNNRTAPHRTRILFYRQFD